MIERAALRRHVRQRWSQDVIVALQRYVAIPAESAAFDPAWAANGHIDAAADLVAEWCRARQIRGLEVSIERMAGRSPVVLCVVPASIPDDRAPDHRTADDRTPGDRTPGDRTPGDRTPGGDSDPTRGTVLLYGHLDKQPAMVGWRDGLGAWIPVIDGDRLYGRGGADDGYSAFASLTAIEAIEAAGGVHGRCVVLIEASEESGSPDLPAYVDALAERIGTPELVICLDSGCGAYDELWLTTSLRGMCRGSLRIDVLTEGVHSGNAGGIVPSSFRIARQLLSRIEDETTGRVLLSELTADVPDARRREAAETAKALGEDWASTVYPFADGVASMATSTADALLRHSWEASVAVVGAEGFPPLSSAGNVLRPFTSLGLAIRLPPTVDAQNAQAALHRALTTDPPHGARVQFECDAQSGWDAPPLRPWLADALQLAATEAFGGPVRFMGEGGSIPFMGMLGRRYPDAQFVVTGVLGPASNAHGPNEFLHLPTAEGLTVAIATVIDHHARGER